MKTEKVRATCNLGGEYGRCSLERLRAQAGALGLLDSWQLWGSDHASITSLNSSISRARRGNRERSARGGYGKAIGQGRKQRFSWQGVLVRASSEYSYIRSS